MEASIGHDDGPGSWRDNSMTNPQALRCALPEPLARASEGMREALLSHFVTRTAAKDEALVHEGEMWRTITFIESGALRLFYSDAEGRDFNKGFFLDGQFLLPMAPSARRAPSLFTVTALEPCTLWLADYWACRRQLEDAGLWSEFALPFAEWLADEKFRREYEFLVYGPRERYRRFVNQYPHLVARFPDYHLASYLGMTAVSYSRIKRAEVLNTRK